MPWKNPRCPKCDGKTKQDKIIDDERCFYKCKRCGHEFIDWKHKKKRKLTEKELIRLAWGWNRRRERKMREKKK